MAPPAGKMRALPRNFVGNRTGSLCGDEGGGGDSFNNARFINKDFWGQMLRLDVDNDPANLTPNVHSQPGPFPSAVHAGTYKVPADNPFIGFTSWHNLTITPSTVRTEIFATGLRNPFRFTIDQPTGRIVIELPAVNQTGSASLNGSLTFGI